MYRIEYFAPFSGQWQEYIAPSWGARIIRHNTQAEAEARMERLKRDHPRDQFRVVT
jgi:hypothetical protein